MPNGIVIGLAPARGQCQADFPIHLGAGAAVHAAAPALDLRARGFRQPTIRHHRALLMVVTLSALLHVAAVGVLLLQWPIAEAEGAGGENEGVSIELVRGTAIESMASAATAQAAASAEVNADSGAESQQNQPEQQAADNAPKKQPPEPLPSPEPNAPDAEIAATPEPEPPERENAEADDGKARDDTRQPAVQAQSAGGPASRGRSDASAATEASAGASAGRMSRYAAAVHAAIVKRRPRHGGASGRVKVLLCLSLTGEVTAADIAATSGITVLDRLALEAVRRARFPLPPEGAREGQLRYTVSIDFR